MQYKVDGWLHTWVYETTGVDHFSPSEDLPGEVDTLHELGYSNYLTIAANAPNQSFSWRRES